METNLFDTTLNSLLVAALFAHISSHPGPLVDGMAVRVLKIGIGLKGQKGRVKSKGRKVEKVPKRSCGLIISCEFN